MSKGEDNKRDRLENYLRNLTEGFDGEPSHGVWASIDANLKEEAAEGASFWMLADAALLLLALFFIGFSSNQSLKQELSDLEVRMEEDRRHYQQFEQRLASIEDGRIQDEQAITALEEEVEHYKALLAKERKSGLRDNMAFDSYLSDTYETNSAKRVNEKNGIGKSLSPNLRSGGTPIVQDLSRPLRSAFLFGNKGLPDDLGLNGSEMLSKRSDLLNEEMSNKAESSLPNSSHKGDDHQNKLSTRGFALYADLGHELGADIWQGNNHQTGVLYYHPISEKLTLYGGLGYWEKIHTHHAKSGELLRDEVNNLTTEALSASDVSELRQNNDMLTMPIGFGYALTKKRAWIFGLGAQWTPVASISQDLVLDYDAANSPTNGPYQDRIYSNAPYFQLGTGRAIAYAQFTPSSTALRMEIFYDKWLNSSEYSDPFSQVGISAKLFFHQF